jgi:hypothetical protein
VFQFQLKFQPIIIMAILSRDGEAFEGLGRNHGLCRSGLRSRTKDDGKLIAKDEKRGHGGLNRG